MALNNCHFYVAMNQEFPFLDTSLWNNNNKLTQWNENYVYELEFLMTNYGINKIYLEGDAFLSKNRDFPIICLMIFFSKYFRIEMYQLWAK